MLLSIIVPIYNTANYVEECVESLLNQDLEDMEIICINDGSTDSSLSIINSLAAKHQQIQVYSQVNHGLSYTRNKGVELSSGKYIYFMDSDDVLSPNALGYIVKQMEDKNLDLYTFDAESFIDGDIPYNNEFDYKRKISYGEYKAGENLFDELVKNNEFTPTACLFVTKAELINKYHLKFLNGILHEDEAFTPELFLVAKKSMHENFTFFNRRIRPNSIMTKKKTFKNFEGYYTVFMYLYRLYYQHNNPYALKIRLAIILDYALTAYNSLSREEQEYYREYNQKVKLIGKQEKYFIRGFWFKYNSILSNLIFKLVSYLRK